MQDYTVWDHRSGDWLLSANTAVPSYDTLKALIARSHPATAEHSIRVRICATKIGRMMRLSGFELSVLTIAAELHDIGKVCIPQPILDRPGSLNDREWAVVRQHPYWGAAAAQRAFPSMPEIAMCIGMHHERLDGSGYPGGLRENQIPLLVRIVSVADAYAALTEDRAYRKAYTDAEAIRIVKTEEAHAFDRRLVEILETCIR